MGLILILVAFWLAAKIFFFSIFILFRIVLPFLVVALIAYIGYQLIVDSQRPGK